MESILEFLFGLLELLVPLDGVRLVLVAPDDDLVVGAAEVSLQLALRLLLLLQLLAQHVGVVSLSLELVRHLRLALGLLLELPLELVVALDQAVLVLDHLGVDGVFLLDLTTQLVDLLHHQVTLGVHVAHLGLDVSFSRFLSIQRLLQSHSLLLKFFLTFQNFPLTVSSSTAIFTSDLSFSSLCFCCWRRVV